MTILPLLLFLSAPPAIFEPTGRYAMQSTPDAAMASRSQPQTSGGDEPAASGVRLQFWSASWCGYCPPAKAEAQAAADALGIKLEVFDWDRDAMIRRRVRVTSVPTLFIVKDDKISERRKFVGFTSRTRIVETAHGTKSRSVTRTRTAVSVNGDFFPEREEVILHLMSGSVHRGKFTRSQLDAMTDFQIIDLHNREHGVVTVNGVRQ